MSCIVCPLCRLSLERGPRVWRCARGHSFDVAREGYVNLLPAQHKNSRSPGDRVSSLLARRAFLDAGHYAPLRDAVLDLLAPLRLRTLVDIGCGEGYYTGALRGIAEGVIGLDVAQPAIRLAAKRFGEITWIVGSGARLPMADSSVEIVTTLFTPLHVEEMHRVLAPGGRVLMVTPAATHLWTLREQLFEEVRAHAPEKFLAQFAPHFELAQRRELLCPLALTQQALKQLLEMTPYVWKARPEKRALLEAQTHFATIASFTLLLFRKREAPPAPAR